MSLHGSGGRLALRELAPVLRIHGRVGDFEGSPVGDARVETYYAQGSEALSAVDGSFELEVRNGQHMHLLRILHQGYAEARVWVEEIHSEACVEVELQAGGELRGSIQDSDGAAIEGAELRHGECWCSSKADGSFAIGDLPAGRQRLKVKAQGFAPCHHPVEVFAGESRSGLIITLQPGHMLIGRLLDAQGEPVASALICAQVMALDSASRSTFSDGQGRFQLSDLPSDTSGVEISGPGFASVVMPVQLDGEEVVLELQEVAAHTGAQSAGTSSR